MKVTIQPVPTSTTTPQVIWEECACPLCGSTDSRPFIESPDPNPATGGLWFAVVQCQECSLRYTNPRPNIDSIGQFYPTDYLPHRRLHLKKNGTRRWNVLRPLRGKATERRSLPWHGEGRLLDFGCGAGGFLARMAEQGWKVTGLDASLLAVKQIREELGLRALQGTLPHPELQPESFDVITLWCSLEHVHEPRQILQEAHRLLVPGGRILIVVPNIESWPFRWFGPSWFALDLPRHLIHFEPKTLRAMLELSGFEVGSIRGVRHGEWLRNSARIASRDEKTTWWQRLFKFKAIARLMAWLCFACGRSDCMVAVAEKRK